MNMKKTIQALIYTALILCTFSGAAQKIYIAQNATGNGTSWADAAGNLKTALDNATPGTQIWVKEGTYYPTTCTSCSSSDRNFSFSIPNEVKLFGGFAGNESAIDQRDIANHPTYLSGDIDQNGTLENNSYSIILTTHVSSETVADGFIITGGNAHDPNYPTAASQNSGGGWFNNGSTNGFSSSPTIRNCRFENNYAWGYGGGMMNEGSFTGSINATVSNCIFTGNSSRSGGGAIYDSGSFSGFCSPSYTDCLFVNNECMESDGGAVFNIGSENGTCNPTFTRCNFMDNTAAHDGGAIYSFGKNGNSSPVVTACIFENNTGLQGGAIYSDGTFAGFSGMQITDCRFTSNAASSGDGGAMYNSGFLGSCNPIIINSLFEQNTSLNAGGSIFNHGVEGVCNPVITNCRFIDNHATTYGGAMYNQGRNGNASPTITNCLFAENKALSAGAIYNLGAEQGNANALITNCTFYKNNANVGGAIYANAGEDASGTASPTVANCIFWENTGNDIADIFRIINGTPTISYSLVDKMDCDDLYHGNGGSLTCLDGMIFNEDPQFVSAANGNFHLENNSPVIDFGNNMAVNNAGVSIDLDSMPRIFNGTVDFGVFEFGSAPSGPPVILQQPTAQAVCEGEGASFNISAAGNQPLSYQWFKDGVAINGAEADVFTITSTTISDSGSYQCIVTNGNAETVASQSVSLTVQEPLNVSLIIMASQETVCEDEEITLTAMPINGGNVPTYQWYLNGNAFGGNVQTFNISTLSNGDTFKCEVISSENCVDNAVAISNELTIHVENTVTAALTIAPNEAMPCEGQPVTFTASPDNGGSTPSFQWFVNGNPTGNNSLSFEYIPQSGDEVQCEMTSSKTCVDMATILSEIFQVETIANETSTISITPSIDSIICLGAEITFSSTIEHGGDSPVYEWLVNGSLAGGNDATFVTSMLQDGDEIICQLTSSLVCLEENPVTSNAIVVAVDSCMVDAVEESLEMPRVRLFPNPSDGRIFVEISGTSSNFTTRLLNTHGQILMSNYDKHPTRSLVKQEMDLTNFPQGIYYFQIITNGTITTERIVVF